MQPLSVVAHALDALRASGISSVNVDLMFGLPHQTLASIEQTVRCVLALALSRLAIFGYAHVPWMKSHQKLIDAATLPGAAERLRQAALARAARGGGLCGDRHRSFRPGAGRVGRGAARRPSAPQFPGLHADGATTLIGLGASSICRTPDGFAQNAPDTAGWRRAIEAGRLPTARGKAFEGEDLLRSAVIEALLCYFEVDLAEAAARHRAGAAVFAADLERLAPMVEAGWVEVEGARVVIRRHRQEIARLVASTFDAYLGADGRHSVAV